MIRFHLDEHGHHGIARALRGRGIDVSTTTDAGLLVADDEVHLDFARSENRVVFTNDADFLRLAQQDAHHPGIVYCAPGAHTVGEIVRHLCLIHDCLEAHEMAGKIEYL